MWKSLCCLLLLLFIFSLAREECRIVLQKTKRGIDFMRLVEERVTCRTRIASRLVTGSRCRGGIVNSLGGCTGALTVRRLHPKAL
jgi:hypothetical protein